VLYHQIFIIVPSILHIFTSSWYYFSRLFKHTQVQNLQLQLPSSVNSLEEQADSKELRHIYTSKMKQMKLNDLKKLKKIQEMYQEKKKLKIAAVAAAKKRTRTRNVQLEEERSGSGGVGNDTVQYTEMDERRRDLLLTPALTKSLGEKFGEPSSLWKALLTPALIKSPASTREKGRKKNLSSIERKLHFLLKGTALQRLPTTLNDSNQRHQETRRHVCLSKDFERIEVHRTTTRGSKATSSSALKRETFFRTDRISSVHRNMKKCAFSLLLKNSNTEIFYPENHHQLEMWTSSLQLLLYHAKDQGGLARLRHKINNK